MGIYLDDKRSDDVLCYEVRRQRAADGVFPIRAGLRPALDGIVLEAALAYRATAAAISIIRSHQQVLVVRTGVGVGTSERSESFCDIALQQPGEPLVVPDAHLAARFRDRGACVDGAPIRFYAGQAIVDAAGYPLGALCVFDATPREEAIDTAPLVRLARDVERILLR